MQERDKNKSYICICERVKPKLFASNQQIHTQTHTYRARDDLHCTLRAFYSHFILFAHSTENKLFLRVEKFTVNTYFALCVHRSLIDISFSLFLFFAHVFIKFLLLFVAVAVAVVQSNVCFDFDTEGSFNDFVHTINANIAHKL